MKRYKIGTKYLHIDDVIVVHKSIAYKYSLYLKSIFWSIYYLYVKQPNLPFFCRVGPVVKCAK